MAKNSAANTTPSYSRGRIGSLFVVLGVAVIFSALIVNPWVGEIYRPAVIKYGDVMLGYAYWAVAIGLVIAAGGLTLRRFSSRRVESIVALTATCLLILLSDRLFLAELGLPLWTADAEMHYRHRPSAIRSWGPKYGNKIIRINKHGQHDDDFPLEKPENEFRGLIIGDSIVMGHGVESDETFSNQLEQLLTSRQGNRRSYQIINAGVQGYSTHQEFYALKEALAFKPDFIAIGFCMNDLIDGFVVDRRFGGSGLDYHGVVQLVSPVSSYFFNETGYGRIIQNLQNFKKPSYKADRLGAYRGALRQALGAAIDDDVMSQNWEVTLHFLDKIYDTAETADVKIALLMFPHTFQLWNEEEQAPQGILNDHARSRGIGCIDFTDVFENARVGPNLTDPLIGQESANEDLQRAHARTIEEYFLDDNHLSVAGHALVAAELYSYVLKNFSP